MSFKFDESMIEWLKENKELLREARRRHQPTLSELWNQGSGYARPALTRDYEGISWDDVEKLWQADEMANNQAASPSSAGNVRQLASNDLKQGILGGQTNPQTWRNQVFNGTDCGGMSADFAGKIAKLESGTNCRDNKNNYECVNKKGSARGIYQMQTKAMKDAGYIDSSNRFVGKNGINSWEDFLHNPLEQERAMCGFLETIDRSFKNNRIYKDYEDQILHMDDRDIKMTHDLLLAMGHRQGAQGARWGLHSMARRPDGKYYYIPKNCYQYVRDQKEEDSNINEEDLCNNIFGRVKKITK